MPESQRIAWERSFSNRAGIRTATGIEHAILATYTRIVKVSGSRLLIESVCMPWNVSLDPNYPIVELSYSGLLTALELEDSAKALLGLASSHHRRLILADCTSLEGGHSVVDLYFLARSIAYEGVGFSVKEAAILPINAHAAGLARFWETTAINRGLRVQCFASRAEAVNWLLKDDTTAS